jgi:putative tricarboxylic transport membrane protein
MNKDLLSGLVLLLIAGLYYLGTGAIADSTLSDEVGASGLPRMLSIVLACLGLLLIVRTLTAERRSAPAKKPDDKEGNAHLPRAVGFLAFGAAYVLILPFLGYVISIALLIAGIAVFERTDRRWMVPVTAIGGAVLYWAIFVKLLGVNQPTGALWQGMLS